MTPPALTIDNSAVSREPWRPDLAGAAMPQEPGATDRNPGRLKTPMALSLTSPAFAHGGAIPRRYTCDGEDRSPPLRWSGVPTGTRSLVLIVDDPDAPDPQAPRMTWVHWVLYNLPPGLRELPEGASPGRLPPGTRSGLNDWKRPGYGGPCPPIGRHRYFHRLYALDAILPDLGPRATRVEVEDAMAGHVLEHAELVGTYQR